MSGTINAYAVVSGGGLGSHEWGGEYHYDRDSAEARAEELGELRPEFSFGVVSCTVAFHPKPADQRQANTR